MGIIHSDWTVFNTKTTNGLLNNLVSYYKLDSDATDAHGLNDGTATNVTWNTSDKVLGTASSDFNGSTSKVDAGFSFSGKSAISLSFWANPDSWTNGAFNEMINDRAGGGSSTGIIAYHVTTNDLDFQIRTVNDSTTVITLARTKIPTGSWSHVVMTYDGSDVSVFINGVLEGSYSQTGALGATGDIAIGSNADLSSRVFDGSIDEVGFRDSAITPAQVSQLYNSGSGLTYESFDHDHTIPPSGYIGRRQFEDNTTDDVGTYNLTATSVSYGGTVGKRHSIYNGSTSYASTSSVSAMGVSNDHTLVVIFKLDNTTSLHTICANTIGVLDRGALFFNNTLTPKRLSYGIYNGAWSRIGIALDDTDWHIVVCTWDAGTNVANIYLDSETAGLETGSVTTKTTTGFRFGSRTDGSFDFDGNIQEAFLYDRNMSDDTSEITDLVNYFNENYP